MPIGYAKESILAGSDIHIFTEVNVDTLSQMSKLRDTGEFFWLGVSNLDASNLVLLGDSFGWHPLLIEDLEHGGQRPKVEEFEDHVFMVTIATIPDPDERVLVRKHECALIVHGNYLVTFEDGAAVQFDDLRKVIASKAQISAASVVHRVLDMVVDSTLDASDRISSEVERLEQLIDERVSHDLLVDLRACRRSLVQARSVATAQRDALVSVSQVLNQVSGLEHVMQNQFRDVVDHTHRAVDEFDVTRTLLDDAFEAYYTMLVAKQGVVAQRLTVVATVFLPLTFITGFFGQNFEWMVSNVGSRSDFLVYGLGSSFLAVIILLVVFRKLEWW